MLRPAREVQAGSQNHRAVHQDRRVRLTMGNQPCDLVVAGHSWHPGRRQRRHRARAARQKGVPSSAARTGHGMQCSRKGSPRAVYELTWCVDNTMSFRGRARFLLLGDPFGASVCAKQGRAAAAARPYDPGVSSMWAVKPLRWLILGLYISASGLAVRASLEVRLAECCADAVAWGWECCHEWPRTFSRWATALAVRC